MTPSTPQPDVTLLIERWQDGDTDSYDHLFRVLYDELRRLAVHQFQKEEMGHTLQPTAVVHEAYLKLAGADPGRVDNRRHFFALAAKAMRQVLIDHARRKHAGKRAGARDAITLTDALGTPIEVVGPAVDALALDQALSHLAKLQPRAAQVVELRYFAGLTAEAAADVLQITRKTVSRDWRTARLWLLARLESVG